MKGFKRRRWRDLPVLSFAGCEMRAFLGPGDTARLSCYHIKVPAGGRVAPAYHKKASELIWVLEGGGSARLGRSELRLKAGDSLFIPPPVPHGFRAGRSGMVLLAMLTPRVDSQTDFYSVEESHGRPKVLAGTWKEKGGKGA